MNNTRALTIFLRIYGVVTVALFAFLFVGFATKIPILAEHGGALNWLVWNDVRFGHDHAHVALMLLLIYTVWGAFLLRAARDPEAHRSFLDFTIWANVAHGLLMTVQTIGDLDRYWSKFFTDIPFVLVLAFGIYLLRPGTGPSTRPRDPATAATPAEPA